MRAGIAELNVYGPAFTARMTELIVGDQGVFAPDLKARTELPMSQAVFIARGGTLPRVKPRPVVREVVSGEVVDCGEFTVEPRAVIQAQPILDCFAYRLEAEGRSVVYSGDAGPCEAMVQLARLGERANVRNLVVSHVTEQFDRPGMRERVIREMAEIYKGNLFFGEDLMEIPEGVRTPQN